MKSIPKNNNISRVRNMFIKRLNEYNNEDFKVFKGFIKEDKYLKILEEEEKMNKIKFMKSN